MNFHQQILVSSKHYHSLSTTLHTGHPQSDSLQDPPYSLVWVMAWVMARYP